MSRLATVEKCTLIITEKPEAANRIATALDINHLPRKAQKKAYLTIEQPAAEIYLLSPLLDTSTPLKARTEENITQFMNTNGFQSGGRNVQHLRFEFG